jgi:hypothetical protein
LLLNNGARRQVALEDVSYSDILHKGQLYAEANYHTKHQAYNEELEYSEALHGPMRLVEEEDDQDIDDRNGTASDQGYLRDK